MLKKLLKISEPTKPQTPYQAIGGEEGTRLLANRFYDFMQTDPHAKDLLAIHPQPMDSIRQRFFEFLSGWLGGPGLFEQKYGHPRLRARHLPFEITAHQRDLWMLCMNQALEEVVTDKLMRRQLQASFYQLATHMINTD